MASAAVNGAVADQNGQQVADTATADGAWVTGWAQTTEELYRSGARLFLLADTPYQAQSPPECLSLHLTGPSACAVPASRALPAPERCRAIAAAVHAKGVTVIDPTSWFCTAVGCPVIVGNVLVFRDENHMTATWSRLLAPQLSAALG